MYTRYRYFYLNRIWNYNYYLCTTYISKASQYYYQLIFHIIPMTNGSQCMSIRNNVGVRAKGARGEGRVRGNHLVQLNSTRSPTPILPTTPQKQQAPEILLRKAKCIRRETFPSYTFYSQHKDTTKSFLLIRIIKKKTL